MSINSPTQGVWEHRSSVNRLFFYFNKKNVFIVHKCTLDFLVCKTFHSE